MEISEIVKLRNRNWTLAFKKLSKILNLDVWTPRRLEIGKSGRPDVWTAVGLGICISGCLEIWTDVWTSERLDVWTFGCLDCQIGHQDADTHFFGDSN